MDLVRSLVNSYFHLHKIILGSAFDKCLQSIQALRCSSFCFYLQAREITQGAKGNCNPIGRTTIRTNQYPGALVSSCMCIKRWPSRPSLQERPIGLANFICPGIGEHQGQKGGVGG
jgi:hypothetical protein